MSRQPRKALRAGRVSTQNRTFLIAAGRRQVPWGDAQGSSSPLEGEPRFVRRRRTARAGRGGNRQPVL